MAHRTTAIGAGKLGDSIDATKFKITPKNADHEPQQGFLTQNQSEATAISLADR